MAKTPKPPGKNGPSTPIALVDALEQLAPSQTDSHWRSEITSAALVPTAKLGGEKRARKLLEWLKPMPYWHVRGLFSVGRGLALAGDSAAKSLIEEGEAAFATAGIEGQFGTLARIDAARVYHALGAQTECDREPGARLRARDASSVRSRTFESDLRISECRSTTSSR